MKIVKPFKIKQFSSGQSYKQAFLKANKWVASNVIARYGEAEVKYRKLINSNWDYAIEATVYLSVECDTIAERHCSICKPIMQSEIKYPGYREISCTNCTMRGYLNRSKARLTKLAKMRKEDESK